jgi:HAD superfamily hydrolase (TIGR01509 family)
MIDAVVFDLDGLLLQSEEVWDGARRDLAAETGVPWPPDATRAMMGMSSQEWSRYMQEAVGVPLEPPEIDAAVVARVEERYRRGLPWISGARDAVARMAARWPLALATSSNREIVDLVIELGNLGELVAVTVSSEEVGAGKPAPDVYLEATRRLGVDPERAVAIEDSTNGLLSAAAAGLHVIAIPNPAHPPAPEGLRVAAVVLGSIDELVPGVVERLGRSLRP